MELLTHLFYFLVCSALLIVAWFVFLFFNNLIDTMQKGMLQGILGTVNTVVLLSAVGVVIYLFALSFFVGVLLAMIIIFLIYASKRVLADFVSAKS